MIPGASLAQVGKKMGKNIRMIMMGARREYKINHLNLTKM
jgi:hypothetical protein